MVRFVLVSTLFTWLGISPGPSAMWRRRTPQALASGTSFSRKDRMSTSTSGSASSAMQRLALKCWIKMWATPTRIGAGRSRRPPAYSSFVTRGQPRGCRKRARKCVRSGGRGVRGGGSVVAGRVWGAATIPRSTTWGTYLVLGRIVFRVQPAVEVIVRAELRACQQSARSESVNESAV